jgi:hypothetical protein
MISDPMAITVKCAVAPKSTKLLDSEDLRRV